LFAGEQKIKLMESESATNKDVGPVVDVRINKLKVSS
jgi:hypothetical protein